MENVYLIAGLGNPGAKYEKTRHNIGFDAVDFFLQKHNLSLDKNGFQGKYTKAVINDKTIFILEPQTFMNLSGDSVKQLADFFKIDVGNIIIIHDDMDLDIGRLRMKPKGSSGGHNGIKSIEYQFQSEDIKRIKIGIGKPIYDTVDYVLGRFNEEERKLIDDAISRCNDALDYAIKFDFEKAMSRYNK